MATTTTQAARTVSPYQNVAEALEARARAVGDADIDYWTFVSHASLLASVDPEHHAASAEGLRSADTYVRDVILDAVRSLSAPAATLRYAEAGGFVYLR